MKIKDITYEDFVNYKKPSMFIAMPFCTFKCEEECGERCCQNSALSRQETIDVDTEEIIKNYIENSITESVVFGGLEPFDSIDDVFDFVDLLRNKYQNNDDVIIYTGYNKDELEFTIETFSEFENIIIKFGRFIPGHQSHYDNVLGVKLSSDNQHAEMISACHKDTQGG